MEISSINRFWQDRTNPCAIAVVFGKSGRSTPFPSVSWSSMGRLCLVLGMVLNSAACWKSGGGGGDGVDSTYTVGGMVSGLSSTLVLRNNGGDDLAITADGSFTFATSLDDGSAYVVTVATSSPGLTCSITNGDGTISGDNFENVAVTCATRIDTTPPSLSVVRPDPEIVRATPVTLTGIATDDSDSVRVAVNSQMLTLASDGAFSATLDLMVSSLELIPIVCIWLIFFPPTAYQRWIDRRASVVEPEESRIPTDLR